MQHKPSSSSSSAGNKKNRFASIIVLGALIRFIELAVESEYVCVRVCEYQIKMALFELKFNREIEPQTAHNRFTFMILFKRFARRRWILQTTIETVDHLAMAMHEILLHTQFTHFTWVLKANPKKHIWSRRRRRRKIWRKETNNE